MNSYEEMGRQAMEDRAVLEAKIQAENTERLAREEIRREVDRTIFQNSVLAALRDAKRGLEKSGIDVNFDDRVSFPFVTTATFGHDRAGRTGQRMSTVVASVADGLCSITVTSRRFDEKKWSGDEADISKLIPIAVEDAVNRWTERGPYAPTN
jgi:hypothetical protein